MTPELKDLRNKLASEHSFDDMPRYLGFIFGFDKGHELTLKEHAEQTDILTKERDTLQKRVEVLEEAVKFAKSRAFLCSIRCPACDDGVEIAPCTCFEYIPSNELHDVGIKANEALSRSAELKGGGE